MPLPTFEKLGARKRSHLLMTAMMEFSKRPYDRVSVFEIAKGAGISRSSFYYYFSDKEDLYDYLLDLLRNEFLESLPDEIELYEFPSLLIDFFVAQRDTERGPFIARLFEHQQLWKKDDLIRVRAPRSGAGQRIKIRGVEQIDMLDEEDLRLLRFIFWECSCYRIHAYYRGEVTLSELHQGMNRVIELFGYGVYGRKAAGEECG